MRIRPVGSGAMLLEVEDIAAVQRWYIALRHREPPGVVDLVPAARTVLIVVDPGRCDLDKLAKELSGWAPPLPTGSAVGPLVEIPVVYDGVDVDEVCRLTRMSRREMVDCHTGADLQVAFCGFLPGFGYLTGLPEELRVTRRDEPRIRVPAGSVGLAGEFTAVYPRSSPGGWRLIGRTGVRLWDPGRDPPALLEPGHRVRFVEATSVEATSVEATSED